MRMIVPRWAALSAAILLTAMLSACSFGQTGLIPHPAQPKKVDAPNTTKPAYADFFMSTKVGSFRMLEYNDNNQPEGHFEMSFTGTVLVDTTEAVKHNRGLKTLVKTEGNVRKEVSVHGREVYHGTGKIIVDGGWHALQWFGRDMNAKLNGYGVFRLNGEFDKDLETGFYWYTDGKKMDWGTGGAQPTVPRINYAGEKPKIKINGKGG